MRKKAIILIGIILIMFLLGIVFGIYIIPKNNVEKSQNNTVHSQFYKDISIVGVDDKGNGVVAVISVEVKSGNGLVLVNINNLLADYLTQISARNAAKVSSNFTGINLNNLDIIYSIKANVSIIEGPSAGAAMTIATIAALTNKSINQSVLITGTIDENGIIGLVGGIGEKAKAAKNYNAKLFLIPMGNYGVGYDKIKKCKILDNLNYCEITYFQKKFELSELLKLEIKQVKTITQAANYTII